MARKNLRFEINPLLAGPSLEARTKAGSPYRVIPLSEVDVDPDQPRRAFDAEALAELAASIKEYGVLNPILVRVTAGGTYRVIAGERRLRACRLLGLDTIPAIIDVEDNEEKSTLAKQLVENIQRQDLSPFERASAVGQLKDRYDWSIREIAKKLGASKSMVQRSLDLLELPEDLQVALLAGAAESKILLLAKVEDRELRKELIQKLDDYSRNALEVKIKELLGEEDSEGVSHSGTVAKTRIGPTNKKLSPEDKRLVDEIQRALGTKIQLLRNSSKKGQGKLVLEFYSSADLEEMHKRLVNS